MVVQWRFKYKHFKDAIDFFDEVKGNQKAYMDKSAFVQKKIANYGDVTKKIKSNNDKRAKQIMSSHILMFVSIFLVLLCVTILLVCSYS